MTSLVLGVGIYAEGAFQAKSGGVNTPVYDLWRGMLRRCYSPQSRRKFPSYAGCSVVDEWREFQAFASWATRQIGFGVPGYHMDKDLLYPGNRVYGPDYCVFVPMELNAFTTSSAAIRGRWPQGVSWKKRNRRFVAQIKAFGTVRHLGLFHHVDDAAQAYAAAKAEAARDWAAKLLAENFVIDPRVIEALENYQFTHGETA